jgi:hypothetical protein
MNAKYFYFILLFFALFSLSCRDKDYTIFSPGIINNRNCVGLFIEFTDTTTYAFISTFLSELQLNAQYINADSLFEIYMRVDSGNVSDYLSIFSNDSLVTSAIKAWPISSYPDSSTYILVTFKNHYSYQTSQNALKLINSLHGLTVLEVFAFISDAGIEVPKGQEQEWIRILKAYPFVTEVDLPVPAQPV